MMIYLKYFKYLIKHKYHVFILCVNCGLYLQALIHDIDKFIPSRFITYANYFFGDSKTLNNEWIYHYKKNKHHWEYWIDELGNPIEIPYKYLLEMYCDMKAMGYNKGSKSVYLYYHENYDKIKLHYKSRTLFEELINYKQGTYEKILKTVVDTTDSFVVIEDFGANGLTYKSFSDNATIEIFSGSHPIARLTLKLTNNLFMISNIESNTEKHFEYLGKNLILSQDITKKLKSRYSNYILQDCIKEKGVIKYEE